MSALTFYTSPGTRARIVRWMLEETGAAYDINVVEAGTTSQEGAYLEINPMGKVPAIVHGDTVVTEAAAICLYLADAFPEANLAPSLGQRGSYYRWLMFTAGPLEAAITDKMLGIEIPTELQATIGYGSLGRVTDVLEKAVMKQSYIAGDAFTAADVYVGSQIGFGLQFGTIESRPAFENYWEKLCQRSAYVRTQELEATLQ